MKLPNPESDSNFEVISIEECLALYADTLLQVPYKLHRINVLSGARIYFRENPDGSYDFYLGTTSVSKLIAPDDYLIQWYARVGYDEAIEWMVLRALYGSFMHKQIAKFTIEKTLSLKEVRKEFSLYASIYKIPEKYHSKWSDEMIKDLLSFTQWASDWRVQTLAVEIPLCSDTIGIATLVDWVGVLNDKVMNEDGKEIKRRGKAASVEQLGEHSAITDFKSGKSGFYKSNIFQLEANRTLFQENFPAIEQVKRYYNFAPKAWRGETPTYTFSNQTDKLDPDEFTHYIELGKKKLTKILEREVMIIDGDLTFGEKPQSLIRKTSIHEVVTSGQWKQFLPNEALPI